MDIPSQRTPVVTATVLPDASYCPKKQVGGWAAWARVDGVDGPIKGYGTIGSHYMPTSTYAEIYAALNGIWLACKYGAVEVLVRSDCMAVQHIINGEIKNPDIARTWVDGLTHLRSLGFQPTLLTRHVKGHGEITSAAAYVNHWADRKSRLAMQLARKGKTCCVLQ